MATLKPTILQRIFCYHLMPTAGWFRLFGMGLAWKKLEEHQMLFSERNGRVNYIVIGGWLIKLTPKWKI